MLRIGHGYDVHRLVTGRDLILGGVNIPHTHGLDGHSDADVLTHAVMDAILGALALGDIGKHFPDTAEAWRGADSLRLMEQVVRLMDEQGYGLCNLDATIIAESPRLAVHIPQMRKNLAQVLSAPVNVINIKATTEETLGFTGQKQGIAAHSVLLLMEKQQP